MTEHWRPIPGWTTEYEVSNLGRVRSVARTVIRRNGARYPVRGRILRPARPNPSSWVQCVTLARAGHRSNQCVHLLAQAAFGPERTEMTTHDHPAQPSVTA
jgi:NUMOD4 motif